jgi:prevent-host-death family protein
MANVTAFEAKTRFGELLARVARGEEIVITKHEKPVARLIPEGRSSQESVRKVVAQLFVLRKQITERSKRKPKLTQAEVKAAIVEGRR